MLTNYFRNDILNSEIRIHFGHQEVFQVIRFSSPTFLFRHQCPTEMDHIMGKLKECGFDGIELYGMFGLSSAELQSYCRKYDLQIVCDHIHYDEFSADTQQCILRRTALGARYLTIDNIPDHLLPGTPGWSEAVEEIHRIAKVCQDYGVQLLYHNHGYDLIRKIDGIPMLDWVLDSTDPVLLKFQPDLGWLELGGGDAAHYLDKYRDRSPIVHLKDYFSTAPLLLESPFLLGENRGGPEYNHFEFRPSGYGVMNFPQLMPKILACNPEWITTDHDMSYERDTYQDMTMSLKYVKELVSLYEHP